MVGAFLCLERSGLFLCPFLRKEVSAVANRIIRCGGKALTRCRSKVHDTFDTIQHVGGFPSGHRHIVHGIRSLGCRELGLRTHLTSLCAELVEILSGCTGHGGYLAHRRIEIGCCFYSSNAKNCNCSRGRSSSPAPSVKQRKNSLLSRLLQSRQIRHLRMVTFPKNSTMLFSGR